MRKMTEAEAILKVHSENINLLSKCFKWGIIIFIVFPLLGSLLHFIFNLIILLIVLIS
jgi:hypothetical protein